MAGLIVLACAALYARVSGAWFCGYDDFNESYRAAFFDAAVPSRILTATHFTSFMYRPLTSALQLATWDAGHGALAFRLRNLLAHLISVALVYGIAWIVIGRSISAAATAAALFAFDPFANEAVVVAIWTNTIAYALLFGSFLLFLLALRDRAATGRWAPSLAGSFAVALVAMFTYEPTIVVLGLALAYLALCCRPFPSRSFLYAFAAGCAVDVAIFFGVRRFAHVTAAPLLPFGTIAKSLVEYLTALALPIDPILANRLFGVPLPSSGQPFAVASFLPAIVAALLLLAVFFAGAARSNRERAQSIRVRFAALPWRTLAFLTIAIPISLVPIVAFRDHVSEFNLYVPAAFAAIAASIVLARGSRDRVAFAAVAGLLLLSYAAGTWVRNGRVIACARVASAIVSGLPIRTWHDGTWHVRLATPANEHLTPRYGIYDYAGIETLEVAETRIRGAEEAIRLATGNVRVNVDVVAPSALETGCSRAFTCYDVLANGAVKNVEPKPGRRPRGGA